MEATIKPWAEMMKLWLQSAPFIVVCLAGLIVALSRWRICPAASCLVALGCGVELGCLLVMPIWIQMVAGSFSHFGQMVGWVWTMLGASATGLLIAAAFVGRGRGEQR